MIKKMLWECRKNLETARNMDVQRLREKIEAERSARAAKNYNEPLDNVLRDWLWIAYQNREQALIELNTEEEAPPLEEIYRLFDQLPPAQREKVCLTFLYIALDLDLDAWGKFYGDIAPETIPACVAIVIALIVYNAKTFDDEIPLEEVGVMWENAAKELDAITEEYPEIEDRGLINLLSHSSRQYIHQRIGALIYSIRNWNWNKEQGREWAELLDKFGFWDEEK